METATSAGSSLAEAFGFGKATRADEVWQEVRFDSPAAYLECRRGELVLETLVSIHTHGMLLNWSIFSAVMSILERLLLAASQQGANCMCCSSLTQFSDGSA
jgi:hypothetical protein